MGGIPPVDIDGMRDLHHGFQSAQARDLLEHAITQFPINLFMISENKVRLKEAWDTRSPFVELVERAFEVQESASDAGWPIDDRKIMTEVYAFIYQTGILTEDCEKWDVRPNLDKPWAKFQMHFTDAQRKIRRSQKQTAKQTVFHGENVVLTDELERENYDLIKMLQIDMMDTEHITKLTRTLV